MHEESVHAGLILYSHHLSWVNLTIRKYQIFYHRTLGFVILSNISNRGYQFSSVCFGVTVLNESQKAIAGYNPMIIGKIQWFAFFWYVTFPAGWTVGRCWSGRGPDHETMVRWYGRSSTLYGIYIWYINGKSFWWLMMKYMMANDDQNAMYMYNHV